MTLLRGDGVWEQYLEETERVLTLRQYGAAVTALMETSLQLQVGDFRDDPSDLLRDSRLSIAL